MSVVNGHQWAGGWDPTADTTILCKQLFDCNYPNFLVPKVNGHKWAGGWVQTFGTSNFGHLQSPLNKEMH